MSDVKPILEVHPAHRDTMSTFPSMLHFGTYFSPTSPKFRELQVRYEALHARENHRKRQWALEPDQSIQ